VKGESSLSVLPRICRGSRAGCKILPIADDTPATTNAFTLIELLVVIAIIIILAGLVLSTIGYVQKKSARSRAETDIAAISAACESYKADNGVYPRDPTLNTATDTLDARTMGDPTATNAAAYNAASLVLYRALSGDTNRDRAVNATDQNFKIDGTTLIPPLTQLPKVYFTFKPNQLSPTDQTQIPVDFIRDPFGNSYGYSTANEADPAKGYNPTFDLWSTAGLTATPGGTPDTITPQWIKNW
jgi:prepilin-type N-terminal cleavage/methylation domain-containing protein